MRQDISYHATQAYNLGPMYTPRPTCGYDEVTMYFMPVECDLWQQQAPGYSLPMARAITTNMPRRRTDRGGIVVAHACTR